jgi:hypothetical protein
MYKRGRTHEQAHEVAVVKETNIPDFQKLLNKLDTNIIVKNIGKGSYPTGSHLNSEYTARASVGTLGHFFAYLKFTLN